MKKTWSVSRMIQAMQIETTRNHVLLITLATFRKMMTTGAVGRTWRDRVISYATSGNGKDTALGGAHGRAWGSPPTLQVHMQERVPRWACRRGFTVASFMTVLMCKESQHPSVGRCLSNWVPRRSGMVPGLGMVTPLTESNLLSPALTAPPFCAGE